MASNKSKEQINDTFPLDLVRAHENDLTNLKSKINGLDKLDPRLVRVETKIETLEKDILEIKNDIKDVKKEVSGVTKLFTWMPFKLASWILGLFVAAGTIIGAIIGLVNHFHQFY